MDVFAFMILNLLLIQCVFRLWLLWYLVVIFYNNTGNTMKYTRSLVGSVKCL